MSVRAVRHDGGLVDGARALAVVAAAAFAAGCGTPEYAIVGGRRVQRPTVAYSNGETFRLEHRRAFPGVFDPARGRDIDDGVLLGRVCNLDLRYDASWYGSRLALDGTSDVRWHSTFTHTEGLIRLALNITELGPGHRKIVSPTMDIDLDVSSERLEGHIGTRQYTLAADGEYLAGRYKRRLDVLVPIDDPIAIYGRKLLATMVPADEALVLVFMLTCNSDIDYGGARIRGFPLTSERPKS